KSFYSADPYLNALIDEFRVWNQALNPAQIEASFESGPNKVSTDPGALQSIHLSLAQPTLTVGGSEAALVSGSYANLTNTVSLNGLPGIAYQSSDTNILSVSGSGLVKGINTGTASVIASYQGLSSTQSVTVVANSLTPAHRW